MAQRNKAPQQMSLPGIAAEGQYHHTCVVCMRPCETGVVFKGQAEWAVVGLMALGLPDDQAQGTVSQFYGCPDGQVPDGILTTAVKVCEACMQRSTLPMKTVGLVASGTLPGYVQR